MKQTPAGRGYPSVMLYRDGRQARRTVHSLVAEAFLGPRPGEGVEVRHLNGDMTDNRLENLTYGTRSDNRNDTVVHGRHPMARKTHCTKGHPLSGENLRFDSSGHRVCRTCKGWKGGG